MRRERIIQEGAVARARPLPQRSNRLYAVKVVEGSEAEAVIRLMRKFMHQRDGVPILSAAASGTRGVVYVEAHHDAHVKRAVDGLELFRHYLRGGVKRVPVDEMITAVAPKMEHTPVEAGKFVRVKRGVYQGDLARVEEVVDDQTVILRLMPRIDLTAAASSVGVAGQRKRSKAGRPPRRRFLPDEVGDVGNVERKRPPWGQEVLDHFAGKYFDAGFQVLTMPMSRLQTSNVLPQVRVTDRGKSRGWPAVFRRSPVCARRSPMSSPLPHTPAPWCRRRRRWRSLLPCAARRRGARTTTRRAAA